MSTPDKDMDAPDEVETPVEEAEIIESGKMGSQGPGRAEVRSQGGRSGESTSRLGRIFSRNNRSESGSASMRTRLVARFDRFMLVAAKGLVFGIIAGLAGLITIVVLQDWFVNEQVTVAFTDQQERIDALENRIAAVETTSSDLESLTLSLPVISGKLDKAEAEIAELNRFASAMLPLDLAGQVPKIDLLAERLSGIQGRIEEQSTLTSDLHETLQLLDSRTGNMLAEIAALKDARSQSGPPGTGGDADSVITGIEATPVSRSSPGLGELEARIMAIESAYERLPGPDPGIGPRVADLESRLSSIQETMGTLTEQVSAADRLILELQEAPTPGEQGAALSLFSLNIAVETGSPYRSLLGDIEGGTDGLPAILVEHADEGVMTVAELQASFDELARQAIRASAAPVDADLMDRIWMFLTSLVQVRPLTPQEGDSAGAVISRAGHVLETGDVEAAISTLGELPRPALGVMSEWIAQARAREDVMSAIATLADEVP